MLRSMTQQPPAATDVPPAPECSEVGTAMQILRLSDADRQVFFDVLLNPPELMEQLKRAFEMHGLHIRSDI